MYTDFVVALVLSILCFSAISALLNTYIFDEKCMYENIIFYGQMILYP